MRKKVITVMMLMIFLISIVSANLITLEEAQMMAKSNNPDLQAAESEMLSAQKTMQSSYLSLGPSASLSYSKTYQNPGIEQMPGIVLDESSSVGLSATQPIFNGGKVILGTQISKNTYKIMAASYQAKQLEIMAETESKYYAVQSNQELVKALEKTLEQSTINLETARAKHEAGLLSKAEYLQMESEKLSSELDLLNMRNALELSKLTLVDYIGYKGEIEVEEFELNNYEATLKQLQSMNVINQNQLTEKLVSMGRESNPSLVMSGLGVSTAKKSKQMAAGNFLPSLNLSYSYNWQNSNLEEDFEGSSTLALAASIPVFPIADNALDYQAAHYDLKSTERSHQSTENSIILGIRSACLSLFTSAKAVESGRLSTESAWETWQQMRERFEQGLVSSSDLLSTEVMVISSDNNYVSAKQNFLKSITSLVQLTGIEDKNKLIEIIEKVED